MKKAKKACFVEFLFYHYRYMLSSFSHGANTEKLNTAITAWDMIKHDLDDMKADESIVQKWASDYIVWKLKICGSMIEMQSPDIKYYSITRRNIGKYRQYIPCLLLRYQLLSQSVLKSWRLYRFWSKLFYLLKKVYIRVQVR
ncbi:MAG: hypothetical protein ACI4AA_10005 [Lachnospiraceae bacterium]